LPFLWHRNYADKTDEQLRAMLKGRAGVSADMQRSELIQMLMTRDGVRFSVIVGLAWAVWFIVNWLRLPN
jgi:hypothetical protein